MASSTPTYRPGSQGGDNADEVEEVDGPLYELEAIRSRCAAGKVTFSKKAEAGYIAEGFSKEAAIDCIATLAGHEYKNSRCYRGLQPFDAYAARRLSGRQPVYKSLYIKLRIPSPSVVDQVYVTSFHP
ncbi:hypothetical protein XFF6994_2300004 [Xanthomonas citri pv. fuscans]|nr:hypothetical protein XFF6994_2300004 [Xanthomonas citri pv. fuscans]